MNKNNYTTYLQTYKSYFSPNIFNKKLKNCLKICPISEKKRSLIQKVINQMAHPFAEESLSNKNNYNSVNDNSCFNQLDIDSVLKDIGLAMIKNETKQNMLRLKIMFTKEFIRELSNDCAGLEIMYKYTVRYRKLNDFCLLNTESNYTVQV